MKIQLIDDVRVLYKRWSVQFSALAGILLAAAVANRNDVVEFLNSLPPSVKPFIPLITLFLSIGAPTLLSALKQPKLTEDKTDG